MDIMELYKNTINRNKKLHNIYYTINTNGNVMEKYIAQRNQIMEEMRERVIKKREKEKIVKQVAKDISEEIKKELKKLK